MGDFVFQHVKPALHRIIFSDHRYGSLTTRLRGLPEANVNSEMDLPLDVLPPISEVLPLFAFS